MHDAQKLIARSEAIECETISQLECYSLASWKEGLRWNPKYVDWFLLFDVWYQSMLTLPRESSSSSKTEKTIWLKPRPSHFQAKSLRRLNAYAISYDEIMCAPSDYDVEVCKLSYESWGLVLKKNSSDQTLLRCCSEHVLGDRDSLILFRRLEWGLGIWTSAPSQYTSKTEKSTREKLAPAKMQSQKEWQQNCLNSRNLWLRTGKKEKQDRNYYNQFWCIKKVVRFSLTREWPQLIYREHIEFLET